MTLQIAYVEDNATNIALMERVVKMAQHSLTTYTEGEVALEALQRERYDLILMDIELAGEMNGLQLVSRLRAGGLTTPVIAVTAYAMLGDREKCLAAGCNDYLPKPLPIMEVVALLNKYDAITKASSEATASSKGEGADSVARVPESVVAVPAAAGIEREKVDQTVKTV
ncbi:MAG: response regulator [Anaerolineae bacterium]|nr:response regulator [Anaerolineae bacterium]